MLAFYGEDDARVTAAADPTAAEMKELGKSFEFHIYPHATHGFLEFQDLGGQSHVHLGFVGENHRVPEGSNQVTVGMIPGCGVGLPCAL